MLNLFSHSFSYSKALPEKGKVRVLLYALMWISVGVLMGLPLEVFCSKLSLSEFTNPWGAPELLINYEGGFVRRGLLGEAIYLFCGVTGFNPILIVYIICFIAFAGVIVLLSRSFLKSGIPIWIIFAIYLCGYINSVVRKDYLMYLLIFAMFYSLTGLRNNARNQNPLTQCGLQARTALIFAITIFAMLIHEAFIFFGLAGIILYIWRIEGRRKTSAALGLTALFLFLLASWEKGNSQVARGIYDSLSSLGTVTSFPETGPIDALQWETCETLRMHLLINFRTPYKLLPPDTTIFWVAGTICWILRFVVMYYLMTNLPAVFCRNRNEATRIRLRDDLGGMLLLTWITMLPMFTVLCCDHNRTIQFWGMGAYIPILMAYNRGITGILPARVQRLSHRINDAMARMIAPRPIVLMLLFWISLAIPMVAILRK